MMDADTKERIEHAGRLLQASCFGAAYKAGWWGKDLEQTKQNKLTFSNKLMLIVSEIAEAMEGDRKGLMDDHLPHREMREVELADAIIRICDLAGAYHMDLGAAIAEKMAYNANREDHKLEVRALQGGKAY